MVCGNCKNQIPDGATFCSNCGANLNFTAQDGSSPQFAQQPQTQQPQTQQPVYRPQPVVNKKTMPVPPSTIGQYMGWMFLSVLPGLIGLILSIVFAADDNNMNRANFFRAMLIWKAILIGVGILAVVVIFVILGLSGSELPDLFREIYDL